MDDGSVQQNDNRMTTEKGNAFIKVGWVAAGIADAIEIGVENLPPLDLLTLLIR